MLQRRVKTLLARLNVSLESEILKYISLVLACCVALVALSLPGFASNDDPYDGDSYLDIPTGTEEDPYNQNVEESTAPEPVVSEDPEPVESEEVTDDTQTSGEEELPVGDPGTYGDSSGSVDTGSEDVPVVQVDTSGSAPTVYNIVETETVSRSPLLDAITSLFGEYQPRTYIVTTYLEDGTAVESEEIVPGLAGLDYNWLAGVTVFMLSLFCIFRMIGGLSKWK